MLFYIFVSKQRPSLFIQYGAFHLSQADQSDLMKVSKSTSSSNNGLTLTFEKSIASASFSADSSAGFSEEEDFLTGSNDFIVGKT